MVSQQYSITLAILALYISIISTGNGSLSERYSTHDEEIRSFPGAQGNCSQTEDGTSILWIVSVSFIALPGNGSQNIELLFDRPSNTSLSVNLSEATLSFGEFGYELTLPPRQRQFTSGVSLRIKQPHYEDSNLRLLHQLGDVARPICWSLVNDDGSGSESCQSDYDYPLLAIETGTVIKDTVIHIYTI